MKNLASAALAAFFLLSACVPMGPGMGGPTYHGANPEVCANIRAMSAQSATVSPDIQAYNEKQLKAYGC